MKSTEHAQARRLVFGLAVVTAIAAVAAQIIEGPPGSGYGWGSVAVSCVLISIPLLVIGFLVLNGAPRIALTALIVAGVMAAVVLLALVGNWAEQGTTARVLDTGVAVLVLVLASGTFALETPLLHRTRH